jgi:NAD(P)-dependent dehydrogenase (short-subunit alcohol dehydrogenase family)
MAPSRNDKNRPAALVTGGATRLGFEFATALAIAGYDIALHYHRSSKLAESAAHKIKDTGVNCVTFQQDLTEPTAAQLIPSVLTEFPNCQVLINSASAYQAATIAETDLALLQQQFTVNFFAPFLLTQAFAQHWITRRAESPTNSNVINILDNKIAFQQNSYAAYLLSKKSLAEFTQLSAIEYAPSVRINGIAPGVVMPGDSRTDDYIQWRLEGIPLKKQGSPTNLIKAMHYLLNNEFVTGQILTVDGGENINHVGLNAENFNTQ